MIESVLEYGAQGYAALAEHPYAQRFQALLMTLSWAVLDPFVFQNYLFFWAPTALLFPLWTLYTWAQLSLFVCTFLSLDKAFRTYKIPQASINPNIPLWYFSIHILNGLNSTWRTLRALNALERLKNILHFSLAYVGFALLSLNMLWAQTRIACLRAYKGPWDIDLRFPHIFFNMIRSLVSFFSIYTIGEYMFGIYFTGYAQALWTATSATFALLVPTCKTSITQAEPTLTSQDSGYYGQLLTGILYFSLYLASYSNTFSLTLLLLNQFWRIHYIHNALMVLPSAAKPLAQTALGLCVAWSIHEQQHIYIAQGARQLHGHLEERILGVHLS